MLLKKFVKTIAAASIMFTATSTFAEPVNLDELLKTLEQGNYQQSQENKQRETEFTQASNQQAQMLRDRVSTRDGLIRTSTQLETQFEDNEIKLANLSETLNKRMG